MTFPPENAWVFSLHFVLASNAAEQNLLIVTVMSFDRAGKIKHNIHVQTRAVFPPTSTRHCPGIPSCAFVCAEFKDSLAVVMVHLRSSCAAGLPADLPWRPA